MQKEIFIKGARENNLKNIDVTIPRDKLVVLTCLSGSGKSTQKRCLKPRFQDFLHAVLRRKFVAFYHAFAEKGCCRCI